MKRTERHIVFKSKILEDICYLSKNLYNRANHRIRQRYSETDKYLDYYEINNLLKDSEDYQLLPAQTNQQVLRLLDKNWKSYFLSLKSYNECPKKFKRKPQPPGYKELRNIVVFTNQQCKIKDGYIYFPKKSGMESVPDRGLVVNPLRMKNILIKERNF